MFLGIFTQKASASLNDQWERAGERHYLAASELADDEDFVLNHCGFVINQPHPTTPLKVISSISVDQLADAEPSRFKNPLDPFDVNTDTPCFWWEVTLQYAGWNPLEHTVTGNPIDTPLNLSFQWQTYETAVDYAIVGMNSDGSPQLGPVVNSCGDPFDPPVVKDQLRGVIRVVQNSLTFDPGTYFLYGNTINSATWNGFPAHYVKLSPPNLPERQYSQFLGEIYYRLEFEFLVNPEGWDAKPIDAGFRHLNSGVPTMALDPNGQPVSKAVLLDGSGGILINPTFSNVSFGLFQIYTELDYNQVFGKFSNLFVPIA